MMKHQRHRTHGKVALAIAAAAVAALATPALADDNQTTSGANDQNLSDNQYMLNNGNSQSTGGGNSDLPDVADRYDGTGIHAGSFWLLPTLETGAFYDSNVYGTAHNTKSDYGAYIQPRIDAHSDWGVNALNASVSATHYQYFNHTSQNRDTFNGSVDGRLDIRRDLSISAGARGGYFEDPVGAFNTAAFAAEPTRHRDFTAWTMVNKSFNRLAFSLDASYQRTDYNNVDSILGGIIAQGYRSGNVYTTGGRVSYEIWPEMRAFADFHYNWDRYDGNGGDSRGWRGLTGLQFDIGRLVRGEVGVGYMDQIYSGGGGSVGGVSYHAGLIWNPTPLITAHLDADRTVTDSATPGLIGMIEDKVKLSADYELRRGLVLTPSAAVYYGDYINSPQTTLNYDLGLQLNYTMNRFMAVGLKYDYTRTSFTNAAPGYENFDNHVIAAYAKARY